jgi:FMN phosphatase YigB (HAD superfamily)
MHEFRLRNTFLRHAMVWDDDYVDVYRKKLVATCTPFDGISERLSRLKQKVKTGLISNAYDGKEQRERIRNSGLEACFDVIVIAGDVGVYKPDPAIFLQALNLIQVAPDNALYIGDSITYDVAGAKSAGMKTALFCRQPRSDTGGADFVITGVDELRVFLDQRVIQGDNEVRIRFSW